MRNSSLSSISCMVVLLLLFYSGTTKGQQARIHPPDYRFGVGAGITVSGFTGDSSGYSGTAMPFGSLFMEADLNTHIGLSGVLNYTIYGVNRGTPYERYRYAYVNAGLAAGYTFMGFLQVGGGYRYGFAQHAHRILLDGNSPSGVTKADIPSPGNYGQWFAMVNLRLENKTTFTLSYGIPRAGIPLKHVQLGVQINLRSFGSSDKAKAKEEKRRNAQQQAQMLKEGVLLVRLKTMHNSLNALEAQGMTEQTATLREETRRENLQLVKAFGSFHFTKVLFFYDTCSGKVRENRLDTILIDHRLQPVQTDTPFKHVFVASIGFYQSPERSFHALHDPQYLKENNISADSSAAYIQYSSQASRIGGIVIMDQFFEPLSEPFPVFTPLLNPTLFRDEVRFERAVLQLSESLYKLWGSR